MSSYSSNLSATLLYYKQHLLTKKVLMGHVYLSSASLQIAQKQLRVRPEDELALCEVQGMKQICHLPAVAINGLRISQFNFTFLAAKG